MKKTNHNDLTKILRKELEEKIDFEFNRQIAKPREIAIIDFFISVQNYNHKFRIKEEIKNLEVVDVFYYANSPLSHFWVEPCYEYYDRIKNINIPELNLDYYTYSNIDKLIKGVLDKNNIDYYDLIENKSFDSAEFWENKHELEMSFIIKCWITAKKKTNSNLLGFLNASDSSGSIYDLDNGCDLWEDKNLIDEYLKSKGIIITKEKSMNKSQFWKRIFRK